MTSANPERVDQALFGYDDGHRQLVSSVRLPPKDLYLLSSASDLASGVRLGELSSYLSGVPLPESKKYALFRTWAASEMPRPGCVWSHVLLLDAKLLASTVALSELLPLFRRPVRDALDFYAHSIGIPEAQTTTAVRSQLVAGIISKYYVGKQPKLSPASGTAEEIESAILAVWSQQWPRLRSSFSFCTAPLSESRSTELSNYDVQVALISDPNTISYDDWVSYSANDAAQNKVTPLRRFLWRYGRDISTPRRRYRSLVELHNLSRREHITTAETALNVIKTLPDPTEGIVLKRDILGIGPASLRLMPAVSSLDFLRILTSGALTETTTVEHVRSRLQELPSGEIGKVAHYYAENKRQLSPWGGELQSAIVNLADKRSVLAEYPREAVVDVLVAREDLVDADTISLLDDDALFDYASKDWSNQAPQIAVAEMLRRSKWHFDRKIAYSRPELFLKFAAQAHCQSRLDQSWSEEIFYNSGSFLRSEWMQQLNSTKEFAAALAILRYPRKLFRSCTEVSTFVSQIVDDAQGAERTTMQAALFRMAIDEGTFHSWDLVAFVLPELRHKVVNANLPAAAESILSNDLPTFYSTAYWDLNKRILQSLSKLHAIAPSSEVLDRLALATWEMDMVLQSESHEAKKASLKLWPWL